HAACVYVGGVDEVDTCVQRVAHQPLGIGLLERADLAPDAFTAAEGHGAEAKLGDEKAGAAERTMTHGMSSCKTHQHTRRALLLQGGGRGRAGRRLSSV